MKYLTSRRTLPTRARKSAGFPAVGERPYATAAVAGLATLAVAALVNREIARRTERRNPPQGRFLEIDGVRLHYVERGEGETLVLLHGNGSMIQDFESSGLLDEAAKSYRVIVFDRPGYGHSGRPRSTVWSPKAQADLIEKALVQLEAGPAIVLGHSWGASVAMALALERPDSVKALVLASGYYYPTVRPDMVALSGPAIPLLGDILRYTLAPLVGRLMWPAAMRKLFGPAKAPRKFTEGFPVGMALRPSQLRAGAADSSMMIPDAFGMHGRYGELTLPVVIVAGELDRLIDSESQSERLSRDVGHSTFRSIGGAGHMVHQTAMREILAAIDEAAGAAASRRKPVSAPSAA